MKVVQLCSSGAMTGPAEPVMEICRWLLRHGHEAWFLHDTTRADGNLDVKLRELGVPVAPGFTLSRRSGALSAARDVARLRAFCEAERVDVLHAHFAHEHHLALLAALGIRRRGLRVVRTLHTSQALRATAARRLALRRSDGVGLAAAAYREPALHGFGLDPERVAVLGAGVDAERFRPGRARGLEFRARLGIAVETPLCGIVSRIKRERRHEWLLRAWAHVQRALPSARLLVIGRGEAEPELRALAAALGASGSVIFAGYAPPETLPEVYPALDVHVWLAEGNDGSCRAVLEGMACGVATVGAAVGAIADHVVDGVTGRLVLPSGDEEPLAGALVELLRDPARAAALGAAGRARAVEVYPLDRRGRDAFAFYQHVLALPPV